MVKREWSRMLVNGSQVSRWAEVNWVVIGSAMMASDVGCREYCSGVGRRILNRCIQFYVFSTISGYPKLLFIPFPYDLQTHKHKYLTSKQILSCTYKTYSSVKTTLFIIPSQLFINFATSLSWWDKFSIKQYTYLYCVFVFIL